MHVTKRIDLPLLERELATAGVAVNALGHTGTDADGEVYTYAPTTGDAVDLPPEAAPVVGAHVAPPRAIEHVETIAVDSILRTTDDLEHDVFVLPAEPKSIYLADLKMSAMDSGNGACKFMEGRLVWKRLLGTNVVVPPSNITVVSQIHDTAAAAWVMNGLPQAGSFRIFVKGAAGRTIDWALIGSVARYSPEGLA